ncbi:hypothetical protein D9M68_102000 [compost metagenome]
MCQSYRGEGSGGALISAWDSNPDCLSKDCIKWFAHEKINSAALWVAADTTRSRVASIEARLLVKTAAKERASLGELIV